MSAVRPMKAAGMLIAGLLVATACSASNGPAVTPAAAQIKGNASSASPIQHVVFIVQENRSFNNLFMGYPGALTRRSGPVAGGSRIPLHAQTMVTDWDIDHSAVAFFKACNGRGKLPGTDCRMNGWNQEAASLGHPANFAYAYVPRFQIEPYWKMAEAYVLADHMFASNLDGSFIAHQFIVASYASHAVDYPVSSWGCEGGPSDTVPRLTDRRTYAAPIAACFDNPSIGTEADSAGLSWRFYSGAIDDDGGLWSSYQADRNVFHTRDWHADVIDPPSRFLTDIAKGQLANITWIAPTYENSDHAAMNRGTGPTWVASVVNSIGTSRFWKTTAIFIMWDDWGGWFDPVKPVYEDYDGLGFRVPLIIISPYAKRGYVTHVQYETASVLKYIEDNFGLPHLAASDTRANDPASDAFDYTQRPRVFRKFVGALRTSHWTQEDRAPRWRGRPKAIIGDD